MIEEASIHADRPRIRLSRIQEAVQKPEASDNGQHQVFQQQLRQRKYIANICLRSALPAPDIQITIA
jgi:hypothetical protein